MQRSNRPFIGNPAIFGGRERPIIGTHRTTRRGYSEEDILGIFGENWLRIAGQVWKLLSDISASGGHDMTNSAERDFIGYGAQPPDPKWPARARLALNFVVNYEEGAEYCILDGDAHSETMLSDGGAPEALAGQRSLNTESSYEFGSRAGVWRILRVFGEREIPLTVYAVGLALERNPAVGEVIAERGYDVVAHGWRWIDYCDVPEAVEREHIERCVDTIQRLTGRRPLGWFTGRPSVNTRRLVVEEGGFLYDCDAINDDLPYWVTVGDRRHLVICHAFDTNDGRFSPGRGFSLADDWFAYMRDAFDWLYAEGEAAPKFLTVAVHCRMIGRPGRIGALVRFLEHVGKHPEVWICRREDVARHWYQHYGTEADRQRLELSA